VSKYLKNIEKTRNTDGMLNFYSKLENFLKTIEWDEVQKVSNFPVLTFRQRINWFLERYELFKMIRKVPGSIIECGVADGSGLMSFAHFCSIFESYHYTRKIIGFDTFEGFTPLSVKDKTSKADHMKKGGLRYDSYKILQKMIQFYNDNRVLGHIEKIELVKGDISKTMPKYLKKNPHLVISLLYMDLDLYKPTKDTLKLLVNRVPRGGLICFDEINHPDYPGETIAVMEELGISNIKLERLEFATMSSYARVE